MRRTMKRRWDGELAMTHRWDGALFRGYSGHEDLWPPSEEHGVTHWRGYDGRAVRVEIAATGESGEVALRVEEAEPSDGTP